MTEQGYHRLTPEQGQFYGTVHVPMDAEGRYSTDDLAAALEEADNLAAAQVVERGCHLQRVAVTVTHTVVMMDAIPPVEQTCEGGC